MTLDPGLVDALTNRGLLRWSLEQDFTRARADQEQALALAPQHPFLLGELLHLKMHVADWADFEDATAALDAGVAIG